MSLTGRVRTVLARELFSCLAPQSHNQIQRKRLVSSRTNQCEGIAVTTTLCLCSPCTACHQGLLAQEPRVSLVQHTFKEFSGKSRKPNQQQMESESQPLLKKDNGF